MEAWQERFGLNLAPAFPVVRTSSVAENASWQDRNEQETTVPPLWLEYKTQWYWYDKAGGSQGPFKGDPAIVHQSPSSIAVWFWDKFLSHTNLYVFNVSKYHSSYLQKATQPFLKPNN